MEANGLYPAEVVSRLLNLTERRLQQLAREGIIPKAAHGKYPLVQCVQGYIRYLQQLARQGEEQKLNLPKTGDPLEFLLAAMQDEGQDPKLRVRAAIAATQYMHNKKSEGGKKEEAARRAQEIANGKFASAPPPKMITVN